MLLLRPVSSQTLVSASSRLDPSGGVTYDVSLAFPPVPFESHPTVGGPYSADEVSEGWQARPDGARAEQSQWLRRIYRDSQGRTRSERRPFLGPDMPDAPLIVEITDIVAGYRYTLDPQNKIAHRYTPPQSGAAHQPAAIRAARTARSATLTSDGRITIADVEDTQGRLPTAPAQDDASRGGEVATRDASAAERSGAQPDPLGARLVDGVSAEGVRYVHSIPNAGGPPRITVSEIWTSTELKAVILSKISDPGNSELTVRLQHLSRSEPDPSLFQVPPGYTIQDEPGEFRIHLTLQK